MKEIDVPAVPSAFVTRDEALRHYVKTVVAAIDFNAPGKYIQLTVCHRVTVSTVTLHR